MKNHAAYKIAFLIGIISFFLPVMIFKFYRLKHNIVFSDYNYIYLLKCNIYNLSIKRAIVFLARFVVFIGLVEMSKNRYKLKDLASSEEKLVDLEELLYILS